MRLLTLLLITVIPWACKLENIGLNPVEAKFKKEPKVQKRITWEQWLLDKIKTTKFKKNSIVYSLQSSGGFHGGGAGNYFVVLENQDKDEASQLLKTGPQFRPSGLTKVDFETIDLSIAMRSEFLKRITPPLREGFNAVGFDFYHYKFKKTVIVEGAIQQDEVLCEFDDPFSASQTSSQHQSVINAFIQLYKKAKKP